MRVAVVGAGAVGCTLGGSLAARGGADLLFVARAENLRALREHGLAPEGPLGLGREPLHLRAEPRLEERPHVLVLATKTHDLEAAAAGAARVARGAAVLAVQNGLAAEAIAARHFPAGSVVGCVCALEAELAAPGRVAVGELGGFVLGFPGARDGQPRGREVDEAPREPPQRAPGGDRPGPPGLAPGAARRGPRGAAPQGGPLGCEGGARAPRAHPVGEPAPRGAPGRAAGPRRGRAPRAPRAPPLRRAPRLGLDAPEPAARPRDGDRLPQRRGRGARAPAWPRGARERGPGGGGARGREGAGFLEPEELLRRCA